MIPQAEPTSKAGNTRPHTGVSVIMTVRNDAAGTQMTLDSLLAQRRRPDEIVIVDGGSTDETAALLARYARDCAYIRIIHAPGANIARGRNLAVANAKYDIIAATDAGCRASPGWLAELVRPFDDDPATEFVAGTYRIAPQSRFEQVVGLATMRGQLEPFDPVTFNPSARSLALRKGLWSRVGGWPEWLDYSEDTWFDHRVRELGATWRFAERAVVDWRPRSSWRGLVRQFYRYGTGRGMTGIDAASFRYNLRNLGIVLALTLAAAAQPALLVLLLLALGYFHVWTFHAKSSAIARHLRDRSAYPLTIAVMNVVLFSHLAGFVAGRLRARRLTDTEPKRNLYNSSRSHRRARPTRGGRHWLCIAHTFPPIHSSGTHRTMGFVRRLERLGWRASVLTVKPPREALDPQLLAHLPERTIVYRCPCPMFLDGLARLRSFWTSLISRKDGRHDAGRSTASSPVDRRDHQQPSAAASATRIRVERHVRSASWTSGFVGKARTAADWFTRLMMTPDSRIGWFLPGVLGGMTAIRRRRPQVIYSTSPCMTAHLIAYVLALVYRIPWVADFRDPWRGNPFRVLRYRSINRWDARLESQVLSRADHITCTSPTTAKLLISRHPSVAAGCTVILNGFDADMLRGLVPRRDAPLEKFVIVHAGEFYGRRSPHPFLAALRVCVRRQPHLRDRLQVDLIGPETYDGRALQSLIDDLELQSFVRALGRLPHEETLARIAGADAAALIAANGPGSDLQIPAKLFEYLALRRPMLTLASPLNPILDILDRSKAVYTSAEPDDVAGIADAIERLVYGHEKTGDEAWSGVQAFEREHRARELVEVFERVTGGSRRTTDACDSPSDVIVEYTATRRDILIDTSLETIQEERVRSSLSPDGRLRPVAGEHTRLVGQG